MAKSETVQTYDRNARKFAEYFKGIGPRIEDIERGLALAHAGPEVRVVEIGCGDGRDAAEITPRVTFYEGYDPSKGLLAIAREELPHVSFVEADALTYIYPDNLDVIYAFASLLHVSKEDMPQVLDKARAALRPGGILYLSLKEKPAYEEKVKHDDYGERTFYFYTPALVTELAGSGFEPVFEDHQTIGDSDWLTIALRKR